MMTSFQQQKYNQMQQQQTIPPMPQPLMSAVPPPLPPSLPPHAMLGPQGLMPPQPSPHIGLPPGLPQPPIPGPPPMLVQPPLPPMILQPPLMPHQPPPLHSPNPPSLPTNSEYDDQEYNQNQSYDDPPAPGTEEPPCKTPKLEDVPERAEWIRSSPLDSALSWSLCPRVTVIYMVGTDSVMSNSSGVRV